MLLFLNPLYGVLDPLVYITYNCSVLYIYIAVVAAIAEDNIRRHWPRVGFYQPPSSHYVIVPYQYEDHFTGDEDGILQEDNSSGRCRWRGKNSDEIRTRVRDFN